LIIQSVIRRWSTMRFYHAYRSRIYYVSAVSIQKVIRGTQLRMALRQYLSATKIQKHWRGHIVFRAYDEHKASVKIQRIWRGFQCYTDFIFTMADIVVAQRIARRWLAKRHASRLRQRKKQLEYHEAAADIQRIWRGYKAHMTMLFSLVHIIVAQSVVRRYIARTNYEELLAVRRIQSAWKSRYLRWKWREVVTEYHSVSVESATIIQKTWRGFFDYSNYVITRFEQEAAISIQRCWRGFWQYSHFVILQFEVVRIQAFIRGHQERTWLFFQRECATVIQAAARRFLAGRERQKKKLLSVILSSVVTSTRLKNVTKRIQRWWRYKTRSSKEKAAGLVIERFFIMVKVEVDREIRRRHKKNQAKREKRRRRKKEADEKLLERVWLTTLKSDEQVADTARHVEQVAAFELVNRRQKRAAASYQHSHNQIQGNLDNYHPSVLPPPQQQGQPTGHFHLGVNGLPPPQLEEQSSYVISNGSMNDEVEVQAQNVVNSQHQPAEYNNNMSRNYSRARSRERNMSGYTNSNFNFSEDAILRQNIASSSNPRQTYVPAQTVDTDALSDVSGITSPSVFNRMPSRFATFSRKELSDDLSLEEAWIDAEINQGKEKRRTDDQYIQRHGLRKGSGQHVSSKMATKPNQQSQSAAAANNADYGIQKAILPSASRSRSAKRGVSNTDHALRDTHHQP